MKKLFSLLLLVSTLFIYSSSFGFGGDDSLKVKNDYQPLRIGVNAGFGVGTMRFQNARMNFFNNYVEATGSYSLTPRTGLLMGVGFNRMNFAIPGNYAEGNNQLMTSNQYFLSAGGYHHVNERLTLTGMAQFSVPVNGALGAMGNSMGNFKTFDFNAQYNVSDRFSIGAGIRYTEGNLGNGFGNTFMNPMMPFGNPYNPVFGNPRW